MADFEREVLALAARHGLVLTEHEDTGRVLVWEGRFDMYTLSIESPWLDEHGVRYRSWTRIAGQMIHSMSQLPVQEQLWKWIKDMVEGFWPRFGVEFTSACFPCHDAPDPASPAGIYAAAFG